MSDLTDLSRWHGTVTAHDVTYLLLPSRLWVPDFNGEGGYYGITDIAKLLGAKTATIAAWVRKDNYVQYQCVASDYVDAVAERKWIFGNESAESTWGVTVGDGTSVVSTSVASVFTAGWHFVWMRFTGGSATGLEAGCDDTVATPGNVAAIAALGAVGHDHTYIGRVGTYYSSMAVAMLIIGDVAITDGEIYQYREATRRLIGV
jgi:hypothetical protein